jgi:hypothetical protein
MRVHRLGRDTTSVEGLAWDGDSFGDPTADAMWAKLAEPLRQVARAELAAGNTPVHILENDSRRIVLLSFARPPLSAPPAADAVLIHRSFANGNYCYDGTLCTYEHVGSGDFLAFDDPDYRDDAT